MDTTIILNDLEVMQPVVKEDVFVNGRRFHYSIEQNTEDWDNLRRGKITASAAKVLLTRAKGVNGKPLAGSIGNLSKGAVTYAKKKALERYDNNAGRGEDRFYSPLMQRGHEMEDSAVLLFQHETGLETDYIGFVSIANFGCSPDRLLKNQIDCGVEIKTALSEIQFERFLDRDAFVEEHNAQLQFTMMVTGAEMWHLCSYSPTFTKDKDKLIITEVIRDNSIISEMIDKMDEMELLINEFQSKL